MFELSEKGCRVKPVETCRSDDVLVIEQAISRGSNYLIILEQWMCSTRSKENRLRGRKSSCQLLGHLACPIKDKNDRDTMGDKLLCKRQERRNFLIGEACMSNK